MWVGFPNANVAMPSGQGGTLAAPVFGAYMRNAHGDKCNDFPQPKQRVSFSPFFSRSSQTGTSGTGGSYDSGSTPSGPAAEGNGGDTDTQQGGGTNGYDPRLYESPPQQAPQTKPPPAPAPAPNPGNGGGNGTAAAETGTATPAATPAATATDRWPSAA